MMRCYLAIMALAILWTAPIAAQTDTVSAASDTTPIRGVPYRRAFTGLAGWILGAAVGGWAGATLLPKSRCYCDDPGLREVLIGIIVGGASGAAVGAAIPHLNSHCSFSRRFGFALLGSAFGTAVGMIPITEGAQAITVPVFSSIGAGFMQWRC